MVNFWCQQKGLITFPICCKSKKASLWSLILYTVFHAFKNVYSPRAGADNLLGTNFWCQQKGLITLPICCKFKEILWSLILYTFCHAFIHVYRPRAGTDNPFLDKLLMPTEKPYHFAHLWQVSKNSLWSLILYTFYMYIAPEQGQTTTSGQNCDINRKALYQFAHLLQVSNKSLLSLILYSFFMILYMYIAPGQGQTTTSGENCDVNRKALSICPFVASLKKSLWSLILYTFSHDFIHVYIHRAVATTPWGQNFDVNR